MAPERFRNTYKEVYISTQAQGNLAFYSDIRVSLNAIAGGYYEGIRYIGNNTWMKSFEFGGGYCYITLIVYCMPFFSHLFGAFRYFL